MGTATVSAGHTAIAALLSAVTAALRRYLNLAAGKTQQRFCPRAPAAHGLSPAEIAAYLIIARAHGALRSAAPALRGGQRYWPARAGGREYGEMSDSLETKKFGSLWDSAEYQEDGAPGEIRTPDRSVRSRLLYPAELRVRSLMSDGYDLRWRTRRDSNSRPIGS